MKKGNCIKLEKLEANPAAFVPTPKDEDYRPGERNGFKSVPVGYSMEGILRRDVEVNKQLFMVRHKRNDELVLGVTETSPIVAIMDDILLTQNSVYRITLLPDDTYKNPFGE